MKKTINSRSRVRGCVLGLLLIVSGVGASHAAELDIRLRWQGTAVWCWAATIAMVTEYTKGFAIEDCQVLAEYDMRLGGWGLCCQGDPRCVRTGGTHEMAAIMGDIFHISGRHVVKPVTYAEIKRRIDDDKPMIAALRKPGSGHVVVISGYEAPNKVRILDPIYGKAWVSYDELTVSWSNGVWTETFLTDSSRGDGSCRVEAETVSVPGTCYNYYGQPYVCPMPVQRPRIVCE